MPKVGRKEEVTKVTKVPKVGRKEEVGKSGNASYVPYPISRSQFNVASSASKAIAGKEYPRLRRIFGHLRGAEMGA